MPTPVKPTLYLSWTDGSPPNVTQPPSSLQSSGWVPGEAPPPDFMNWLFWLTDSWIQWLDYEIENVINVASGISANSTVLSTTGDILNGSNQILNLASTTGILVGQLIQGGVGGIPASTFVTAVSGSTVTMSQVATSTLTGTAITFSHDIAIGANVQLQLDELDAYLTGVINNILSVAAATVVLSTTGNTTSASNQLTSLASTTNIQIGQLITGTNIPAQTFVIAISGSTVTMSQASSGSHTALAVTFGHFCATGITVQRQLDQLDAYLSNLVSGGSSRTVTANTTALVTDNLIRVNNTSGAVAITLPAVASTPLNKRIVVKRVYTSTSAVTVAGNGSELIDDANTYVLSVINQSITLQNNGTTWDII